jgi:hypothetical protein
LSGENLLPPGGTLQIVRAGQTIILGWASRGRVALTCGSTTGFWPPAPGSSVVFPSERELIRKITGLGDFGTISALVGDKADTVGAETVMTLEAVMTLEVSCGVQDCPCLCEVCLCRCEGCAGGGCCAADCDDGLSMANTWS